MIDLLFSTHLLLAKPQPPLPYRGSGRRLIELVVPVEQETLIASTGIASWYADGHGKPTASGERYNKYANTCAATRRYKFGTRLRVTNLRNGKTVICKVNDRGAFESMGRSVDLSKGAFSKIAPLNQGLVRVKIEKIGR